MIPKRLSNALVSRLKRSYPRLRPGLSSAKNVDHRKKNKPFKSVEEAAREKFPIVELNVSRNSSQRVVVKVLRESISAGEFVKKQASRIKKHNKEHSNEPYELVAIDLHPIGPDAIAMPFVNAPSLNEILNGNTQRGNNAAGFLSSKGFDLNKIREIGERARWNSGFFERNLFFFGIRNGKLVLSPLGDLME